MPSDLALLGRLPDREVAWRTGQTVNAVRQKRIHLATPNPFDGTRTNYSFRGPVSGRGGWRGTENSCAYDLWETLQANVGASVPFWRCDQSGGWLLSEKPAARRRMQHLALGGSNDENAMIDPQDAGS
jgi:hypothetical protein